MARPSLPSSLVPKQSDDVAADALKRPPAVLPSHPLGVRLSRRCRWLWSASLCGPYPRCDSSRFPWWIRPRRCRRSCRPSCSGSPLWPRPGEGGRWEDHLRVITCHPAHVRFDLPRCLAGVVQLPEAPHHLDEVVTRVFAVGAAGLRRAQVFTPVGALAALAGQPQPGEVPLTRDDHVADVIVLGFEFDGIFPDALPPDALSLSWLRAAGEQQQQDAGLDPHGVGQMLSGRGGQRDCSSWGSLLLFIGRADKEGIQGMKRKKKKKAVRLNDSWRGGGGGEQWRHQLLLSGEIMGPHELLAVMLTFIQLLC